MPIALSPTQIAHLSNQLSQPDPHIPETHAEALLPSQVAQATDLFRNIIFPNYFTTCPIIVSLSQLSYLLTLLVDTCFKIANTQANTSQLVQNFMLQLPQLRESVGTDVKAMLDGDPAAQNPIEVILCYPTIRAILHYRMAHALYVLGVPYLPRFITEMAHAATGIDIHPGATIGDYFAIDHGTGVVIGATCIIGHHVRLYQGVTLGAKTFKTDENGNILNIPRHPIIEDHVTIYSNASVLGRITIGHDTIIGGNVWCTQSLPPYSRVIQGCSQNKVIPATAFE